MCDKKIFVTNDGSLGLYNNLIQDIYHSKYGAYSESLEKFIIPADLKELVKAKDKIKILDICYGIGYNSKSAIAEIKKINDNAKIEIDALEIDEEVIILSSALKCGFYPDFINRFICYEIICQAEKFDLNKFKKIRKEFLNYIDVKLFDKLVEDCTTYKNIPASDKEQFLHNIYYQYITNSNNLPQKALYCKDFSLTFHIEDARKSVLRLNEKYDLIFMDAFTPNLIPCLWSFEFFCRLFELLNKNGKLLTYTSAVMVRNAMKSAGFCVGKILDSENKSIGTVAQKLDTNNLIKLNNFEEGLLQTKTGIFYRDKNLSCTNEQIIEVYNNERNTSQKRSGSSYMKMKGQK